MEYILTEKDCPANVVIDSNGFCFWNSGSLVGELDLLFTNGKTATIPIHGSKSVPEGFEDTTQATPISAFYYECILSGARITGKRTITGGAA